jgi:hypothetical protein
MADLARDSGIGRARLRAALFDAGVQLRPSGQNTTAGKRRRAELADTSAAALVGASDIRAWLSKAKAQGCTLNEPANLVGRSVLWVRSRLS